MTGGQPTHSFSILRRLLTLVVVGTMAFAVPAIAGAHQSHHARVRHARVAHRAHHAHRTSNSLARTAKTATPQATCSTSWLLPTSGAWNTASNWSSGVPTSTSTACITVPGTYTVTISGFTGQASTLTLGGATGTQSLDVDATDNCSGAINGELQLGSGGSITANGFVDLDQTGNCGNGQALLEVSGGTLSNAGKIQADLGTHQTVSNTPQLDGTWVNTGSIVINTPSLFGNNVDGSSLDNKGTLSLTGSATLNTENAATVNNDTGGSITNNGGTGDLFLNGGTYKQGAGTTSPNTINPASPAVYVDGVTLDYTGTGASSIDERGSSTEAGNLASGQNLTIQATDFCSGAVNATVTNSASFTNAGDIDLTQTGTCGNGQAFLRVSTGTATNSGTIQTNLGAKQTATNDAEIDGTYVNTGSIDINMASQFGNNLDNSSLDNQGTLSLTGTATLTTENSATVNDDTGGSITNNSGSGGTGDLFMSGGAYIQGAGTTNPAALTAASPPVYLDNTSLTYDGTGASLVVFRGSSTLSGNVGSAQNLIVQATDFCSGATNAEARVGSSLTNNGDIDLTQTGGCGGGAAFLEVSDATVTNGGTIQTNLGTNQTATDDAQIDGTYVNTGSIDINMASQFGNNLDNSSLDNKGTLTLSGAATLNTYNGASVNDDANGQITNGSGTGYLYMNGGTYTQGAGTTSPSTLTATSPAVYLANGALSYDGGGASLVVFRGNGTLSGNTAAGQNLIVQATDECGGAVNAEVSLGGSLTNDGDIDLTQAGGCGGGDELLEVPNGDTLTNGGTIQTNLGPKQTTSTTPELDGAFVNTGAIDVNQSSLFGDNTDNSNLDNKGTLSLGGAATLNTENTATVTDDTGGQITNGGTGTGYLFLNGGTYNQGAGTTNPSKVSATDPAVFIDNGTINYTGAGVSTDVQRGATALTGSPAKGQNLLIEATDFCAGAVNATLTSAAAFTNTGTIEFTHAGTCGGGADALTVSSGTLTNKGTLSAVTGTKVVSHTINATVNSTGTINVAANNSLVLSGTLTNYNSTTSTLTGGTYTLAGTFQYTGSSFTATGVENDGATVTLTGTGKFEDANAANAFRNLASILAKSSLTLDTSLSTPGSLSNAGTLGIPAGDTVTVNGNYTQASTGKWTDKVTSATKYGILHATGTSTLAGTLTISSASLPKSDKGDVLTPLVSSSRSGTFATVTGTGAGTMGDWFTVAYTATGFTLTVQNATMTLTPSSGAPGSGFTVSGSGWAPNETVKITFGTTVLTPAVANSSGSISQAETVPSGAAAGTDTVKAVGQTSGASDSATFTVT